MSSRARRPYLMGSQSVGNFYKSDVRFLKEIVGRESEFEKPYIDEDRAKMHFDFPVPDWPPFPPVDPWPELPPGPTPGLSLCGITCYEPGGGDCTEPIWCHPSIWCGTDMSCNLCSWVVSGATTGYSWKHIVDGVPSKTRGIEIWIDETLLTEGKALIHAQMQDPCGNLCGEDLEVTCKVCPADIAMTWDTVSSPTTIGRSESVSVYVKDGVGDYKWSVTGTGFSIAPLTAGVVNSLVADATACGPATITVTDFCGTVVTAYVRCTEASDWVEKTANTCVMPGPATYVDIVGQRRNFEYIVGYQKQIDSAIYEGGGFELACDDPCDDPTCAGGAACPLYVEDSPCLTDMVAGGNPIDLPCTKATWVSENQYQCWSAEVIYQDYYEWECI